MLRVLTDRYGKISVIARGVRKITSRRAGNVELLNRVKLHLFKSKSYTLSEAESIETYPKIKANLTLSTTAFHVVELVDRLIPEESKNDQVYRLTTSILELLEENPRQIFVRAFEVKLISLLGFADFQPSNPGLEAQSSFRLQGIAVDREIEVLLAKLEEFSWKQISEMDITRDEAIALERVLRYYLEKILESPLKSSKVMRKLK